MRPLMLKGHSGPIQKVRYNREGDLLFSCAKKDSNVCVWYAHSGERLGTYNYGNGAIFDMEPDYDTKRLLTASSDRLAVLWDAQTAKELCTFGHKGSVRGVSWAEGCTMFLTVQDNNFNARPAVLLYNLPRELGTEGYVPPPEVSKPLRELTAEKRISAALWGPLNTFVITASAEDGFIRQIDVETGAELASVRGHNKAIRSLAYSKDKTMFVSASVDHTAKLWDTRTLGALKTYKSDRPLNAASISPLMNHVIAGGGQDAMNVTVTSAKQGHFEVDFFHTVYMDFLGAVKGHFGPVNTLAFNPDGRSYASGGEDGYIRVHHFDPDYFATKEW